MNQTARESPPEGVLGFQRRLLVLGLGNDILSDDAVGLHIAREIPLHLRSSCGVEIQELAEMGLSLLDYMVGFHELILIDAIQTGQAPPGFLHEFEGEQLKVLSIRAPHCLGISEVLALAKELGLAVPSRVRVLAVEVSDPFTVGTELTPPIRLALPRLIRQVIHRIESAVARLSSPPSFKPLSSLLD